MLQRPARALLVLRPLFCLFPFLFKFPDLLFILSSSFFFSKSDQKHMGI